MFDLKRLTPDTLKVRADPDPAIQSATEGAGLRVRRQLVHREIVRLAALAGAAIVAFLVTRAIAASNRDMNLRDAAEWYRRGEQQLAGHETEPAIQSFRRAASTNPGNKEYAVAYAHALAIDRQTEAARHTLLDLRDAYPEDAEIDLELARLAASDADVTSALKFYHYALYTPWAAEHVEARSAIRLELIDVLLAHDQTSRALSELLGLVSDLPDTASSRTAAGQRFLQAGDPRRALEQFQRALHTDPDSQPAIEGAGLAAFNLGDYPAAVRFLRGVRTQKSSVQTTRQLAELVLSDDPLARGLSSRDRRRRLADDLAYVLQQLRECRARLPNGGVAPAEIPNVKRLHADDIQTRFEKITQIARWLATACPPAAPRERALLLIAERHGVAQH